MSRLVRLYPAAWRARYEAELLDALAFRPLTLRGRFDLVRGALDARVHPELAGSRVGAPVPVGPDTGGSIPMPPTGFPWTAFLGVTAGLAFALSALLLFVDTWFIGGEPFPSALLTVGAASLGAATWRTGHPGLIGWIATAILAVVGLAVLSAGSPWAGFTVVVLLVTGTLVVGGWSISSGIWTRRWSVAARGVGYIVLALVLGYTFVFDVVRVLALVFATYALLSLRLATGRLTPRRALTGILGGVVLIGLVSVGSMATSPWRDWDGYVLACPQPAPAAGCTVVADHFAGRARSQTPGALITHVQVFTDGHASLCWRAPDPMENGCWFTSPYRPSGDSSRALVTAHSDPSPIEDPGLEPTLVDPHHPLDHPLGPP